MRAAPIPRLAPRPPSPRAVSSPALQTYLDLHHVLRADRLRGAGKLSPRAARAAARELQVLNASTIAGVAGLRCKDRFPSEAIDRFVRPAAADYAAEHARFEAHAAKMRFAHVTLARFAEGVRRNYDEYIARRGRALGIRVFKKWRVIWFTRRRLRELLLASNLSRMRRRLARWRDWTDRVLERRRLIYAVVRTKHLNIVRLDTLRVCMGVLYAYAELLSEFRERLWVCGLDIFRVATVLRAWHAGAKRSAYIRWALKRALASKRGRLFMNWRKTAAFQVALRRKFIQRWQRRHTLAVWNRWRLRIGAALTVAWNFQRLFHGARGRRRHRDATAAALSRERRRATLETEHVQAATRDVRSYLDAFAHTFRGRRAMRRIRTALRTAMHKKLWRRRNDDDDDDDKDHPEHPQSRHGERARARALFALWQQVLGKARLNRAPHLMSVLRGSGNVGYRKYRRKGQTRREWVQELTSYLPESGSVSFSLFWSGVARLRRQRTREKENGEEFPASPQPATAAEIKRSPSMTLLRRMSSRMTIPEDHAALSCATRLDEMVCLRGAADALARECLRSSGADWAGAHARDRFRRHHRGRHSRPESLRVPPWSCGRCFRVFALWGDLHEHHRRFREESDRAQRRVKNIGGGSGECVWIGCVDRSPANVEVQAALTTALELRDMALRRRRTSRDAVRLGHAAATTIQRWTRGAMVRRRPEKLHALMLKRATAKLVRRLSKGKAIVDDSSGSEESSSVDSSLLPTPESEIPAGAYPGVANVGKREKD